MMLNLAKVLLIVMCFSIGLSIEQGARASALDAKAVNLSGMQRMLSQRIAKNWLMIGAGVDISRAERQRDESLARFEQNLGFLREYAPNEDIKQQVNITAQTWQSYRTLILQQPDRQQALDVLAESDRLLAVSEELVRRIETYNGSQNARLVNLSGRQRMLSQRIAKLYLARAWKIPADELNNSMSTAIAEFEAALAILQAAPVNSQSINNLLKRVHSQWTFSRAGFKFEQQGHYVPTVITVTTDSILVKMHEVTGNYEQLMTQLDKVSALETASR